MYYPLDISPKRHGRISFPVWEVLATLCIASVGGVLLFIFFNFFWLTAALFSILLCLTFKFCSFNTDESEEKSPDSEKRTEALAISVFVGLYGMFAFHILYGLQWVILLKYGTTAGHVDYNYYPSIIFFVSLFAHHQDKKKTWRDWVTLSFCLVYVFIVLLVHGDRHSLEYLNVTGSQ